MKNLSNIENLPVSSQVFESILHGIQNLHLPPGTRMSETDVGAQLGVSRQPVRDAFGRLSLAGYLDIKPQRATRIAKISDQRLRDAVFLRTSLECASLAEREPLSQNQIKELSDIVKKMRHSVSNQETEAFDLLDNEFHQTLTNIKSRPAIWTIVRDAHGHVGRLQSLSRQNLSDADWQQHQDILDAVISGRLDRAIPLLKTHLEQVLGTIDRVKEENPAYF
ncbi:GntR family transcriptional regulator [Tropicibacter sp. R15_0]|uniref:GntR family transcriptional regulator n=1 Tax=Tropicibacter sp. R15_0 TaxID=2821101 RepID=UPI001ADA4FB6|nr:GntR family transcriptional regulator [Tropicibacter sp. R15_0]MBO9467439.1 GntR family transcriptional regulator [Tropicibacter sp. R15_0]